MTRGFLGLVFAVFFCSEFSLNGCLLQLRKEIDEVRKQADAELHRELTRLNETVKSLWVSFADLNKALADNQSMWESGIRRIVDMGQERDEKIIQRDKQILQFMDTISERLNQIDDTLKRQNTQKVGRSKASLFSDDSQRDSLSVEDVKTFLAAGEFDFEKQNAKKSGSDWPFSISILIDKNTQERIEIKNRWKGKIPDQDTVNLYKTSDGSFFAADLHDMRNVKGYFLWKGCRLED